MRNKKEVLNPKNSPTDIPVTRRPEGKHQIRHTECHTFPRPDKRKQNG